MSCQLPRMDIAVADITTLRVDAIVNAANESLRAVAAEPFTGRPDRETDPRSMRAPKTFAVFNPKK